MENNIELLFQAIAATLTQFCRLKKKNEDGKFLEEYYTIWQWKSEHGRTHLPMFIKALNTPHKPAQRSKSKAIHYVRMAMKKGYKHTP